MMIGRRDRIDEAHDVRMKIEGYAELLSVLGNTQAAKTMCEGVALIERLENHICGQGYFCHGGHECSSDHK